MRQLKESGARASYYLALAQPHVWGEARVKCLPGHWQIGHPDTILTRSPTAKLRWICRPEVFWARRTQLQDPKSRPPKMRPWSERRWWWRGRGRRSTPTTAHTSTNQHDGFTLRLSMLSMPFWTHRMHWLLRDCNGRSAHTQQTAFAFVSLRHVC